MAKIDTVSVALRDGEQITLRSPRKEDAEKFIDYCRQVFSTSDFIITEYDEFVPNLEKQKRWIGDFDSKEGAVCIIAEKDGEIIGNLDFRNNAARRRIQHRGQFGMGVLEAWRSKGVGRALVTKLIEWARQKANPVEKIELVVLEGNKAAKSLYESMGFKEEGKIVKEVKLADGHYMDGILMGLWLDVY